MSNLIAIVVSLILMILAGVAGYTYMQPGLDQADGLEKVALYSTQALQVQGALHAYMADHDGYAPAGDSATIIETFENDGYLKDMPQGVNWVFLNGQVYRDIQNSNTCVQINKATHMDMTAAASYAGCPPCSDPTFQAFPGCTRDPDADTGSSSD